MLKFCQRLIKLKCLPTIEGRSSQGEDQRGVGEIHCKTQQEVEL